MAHKKESVPKSATNMGINLIAVVAYAITLGILRKNDISIVWSVVISVAVLAGVIALLERLTMGKKLDLSAGLQFSKRNRPSFRRISVKLLGFYVTLFLVVLFYMIFPHYHIDHFRPYFRMTGYLLPILLVGGIPYFILLDIFMKEPKDAYWHVGMLVLGKSKEVSRLQLKYHFLGWVVKAFFLPIMFISLHINTSLSLMTSFKDSLSSFSKFYFYGFNFIFSVDLLFITAGYLLTLKIFDSHIRTVEPTLLGWASALVCYPPFLYMVNEYFLSPTNEWRWMRVFEGSDGNLFHIYGLIILALFTIYTLASVAFGLRFSNLTNRGIITNGPYRFMKHPAYIAKNLAWWFASVPFLLDAGVLPRIQLSLMLLVMNFIYYIRAITEERHLSLDPTYVKYATAMNNRGVFAGLYKRFPFLKYDVKRYVDEEGKLKKLWF